MIFRTTFLQRFILLTIQSFEGLRIKKTPNVRQRKFDSKSIENFNKEISDKQILAHVPFLCALKNDPAAAYDSLKIYLLGFDKHIPEKISKIKYHNFPINEWMILQ